MALKHYLLGMASAILIACAANAQADEWHHHHGYHHGHGYWNGRYYVVQQPGYYYPVQPVYYAPRQVVVASAPAYYYPQPAFVSVGINLR